MEQENLLKIKYSYTDQYNQESTLKKTLTQEVLVDYDIIELLLEEFKCFLAASGFSKEMIERIEYKHNEED